MGIIAFVIITTDSYDIANVEVLCERQRLQTLSKVGIWA